MTAAAGLRDVGTRRAAVYCRISADRAGDEAGVTRQREDCEALCAQQGWSIVGVFVDNDLSATKGVHRPQYAALLETAKRGEVDVIVCWHLSRFWRNRRERAEGIDQLSAARVSLRCAKGPDLDLSSAYGRGMAAMLGEIDTMEVELKSERQRRQARQAAEAGKVSGGGHRGYGYAADRITVVEPEAAVIRECAARVLAGESLISLCRDLNSRGVPTSTGGQWRTVVLRVLLASARISGRREHRPVGSYAGSRPLVGEIVAQTTDWPAIVAPADSDRLRMLLSDPRRTTSPGNGRRYLLSGILVCGRCGHPMVARPRGDSSDRNAARYLCRKDPGTPGCGRMTIVVGPTDEYVRKLVLTVLDSPDAVARLRQREAPEPDLHACIRADEDELEALAADHGAGEISRAEWKAARAPIAARLDTARAQLAASSQTAALDAFAGTLEEMGQRWEVSNLSQRRAVVTALLERVVVHPATCVVFDSDRLEPVWRG